MTNVKDECVLITGGSGLVGQVLSQDLSQAGYKVLHLSRKAKPDAAFPAYKWDIKAGEIDVAAIEMADHVIHLAGA